MPYRYPPEFRRKVLDLIAAGDRRRRAYAFRPGKATETDRLTTRSKRVLLGSVRTLGLLTTSRAR